MMYLFLRQCMVLLGVIAFAVMHFMTSAACAGDWPQILGPTRNGIALDEKLSSQWKPEGPSSVWDAKIGSGFAGVAVSEGKSILFHRLGDEDTITAFDAGNGKELWSEKFTTDFQPAIVDDDGPRAVPTIHKGRVYALASAGGLYCVDLKTGKPIWQRNVQKEFKAPAGYFGSGSSPLVEGNLLIVNVGGDRDSAGVVAFDLESGKTTWKSIADQASYSSPIAITLNDRRVILCITRLNFVVLDPATGKELAKTPFGQRGPTVNGAIPVVLGNKCLLTASYGIGAELVSLGTNKVDVIWNDEILASQYTTPILHDGAIFGIDGRQDGGPITLKCFDPESRKTHWSQTWPAYSTLIAADGKLLVMQTNGTLSLVQLNKDAFKKLGSASILPGTTRALPALSNGHVYIRNESTLKCVSLR